MIEITYIVAIIVFVINIPFGFWRGSLRKFSILWFVAIHAPVVISIFIRKYAEINFHFLNIMLFVCVFFAGQLSGKYSYKLYHLRKQHTNE